MREVLSRMPTVKAPHNRCRECRDAIMPRREVYILYSYDPKAKKLSTYFAHPDCARRAGLVRDDHELPGDVVELFWKCWVKKVVEAPKRRKNK